MGFDGWSASQGAMPPARLSASLMCARLDQLGQEVSRLEKAGIDSFHIDIMDGHFVPNLALSPDVVAAIRGLTSLPLHVHLMVDQPESYIEALAGAGADVAFFHLEATRYPLRLAARIAEAGPAPGIAMAPATPIPALPELFDLGQILMMAVEPGFAGQPLVPSVLDRISQVRGLAGARAAVVVDGNVGSESAAEMRNAGADTFVCGTTALFRVDSSSDYSTRARELREAIDTASRHFSGRAG